MTNLICLDKNYSTTKLLTQEKPIIIRRQEDKFESVLFLPETKRRQGEGGLRRKGYFKKSYESKPLISIITVVFNGEKFLEETIKSVINQTYDNIEYIVIDGGSTDGTLDIVKKYEEQIDYWVSEPDNGIYDAMNKGITLCIGEIIGIVNADDYIYYKTLEEVLKSIQCSNSDFTYGSVDLIRETGEIFATSYSVNDEDIQNKKYEDMPFAHPSVFVKRNIYKAIGKFDTQYRLRADYDFVLKILENNFIGVRLENSTGAFRMGGQSGSYKTFYENIKLLENRNISKIKVYKNFITSLIKVFLDNKLPTSVTNYLKKLHKKSRNKLSEK